MEITSLSQLDLNKSYSYADYLSWNLIERVELFKGKIFNMSPAPARQHQRFSADIGFNIQNYIKRNNCQLFYAPFDVRLERKKDDKLVSTVVQPDICVICDLTKLDDRGCSGAPELVVEILSPGNSKKEMNQKFTLYEEAGVLEYWIVQPSEECVLQYVLINGQFQNHKPLTVDETLKSKVLDGFELPVSEIFK